MISDLPPNIKHACEDELDAELFAAKPVTGGDINRAYLLITSKGRFFLKMNSGPHAQSMFQTEQKGLEMLASTGAVRTPKIVGVVSSPNHSGLLMEHIEVGYRPNGFWGEFGAQLADLHRFTSDRFGLDHDNFIGRLPQPNERNATWAEFYQYERLQPQMLMASLDKKLTVKDLNGFEKIFAKLPDLCPDEPPALTHGDLWSGNFLCSAGGGPVLIDPAVSFAHREMDLAMSRLFGGFDRPFYRSYEDVWPLEPGFEGRLPIYQLYYLLVHVNLFGGSYVDRVRNILRIFA